jgi:hypothetical protein
MFSVEPVKWDGCLLSAVVDQLETRLAAGSILLLQALRAGLITSTGVKRQHLVMGAKH